MLEGYSNAIKATKEYDKDHVRFTVCFKDQIIKVTELDLDKFGRDRRRIIEDKTGTSAGSLVRFDHTIIRDERRLRQSQLSYRPQFIVAFPRDQRIEDGQSIAM